MSGDLRRWADDRPLEKDWWAHDAAFPNPRGVSVPEALRSALDAAADAPAIVADGRVWTFDEVDAVTSRIAQALLTRGRPGDAVSVVTGHGAPPALAMFGALKAGMLFAPLDARDPAERVATFHHTIGADLVVTDRAHRAAAAGLTDPGHLVVVEDLHGDDTDPGIRPGLDEPAVVFFTSGSTGTPKGVVHGHRAILHTVDVFGAVSGLSDSDRIAVSGTYSFAATALRVFGAVLNGSAAVTFDPATSPVSAMSDWVDRNGVTVLSFVPSVLRALCADGSASRLPSVRLVTVTGDVLFGRDVEAGRRRFDPATTFMNRFGSSETMNVALLVLEPDDPVPDGPLPLRMVSPNELRLEDDHGEPVAPGEAGRMVVVGGSPALGYWGDPEATAARFFDLPDGRRGVRLDDVARQHADGLVEHLGRWDDRVKVNGVLVHPAEVQRLLVAAPGVAEGAVLPLAAPGGGTRLVAYAAPAPGRELRAWEVRRDLARRLPSALVPSEVVLVDQLPRGERGKLDRASLPAPSGRDRATAAGSSGSSRERAGPPSRRGTFPPRRALDLARLFGEVLALDDVTVDDDFFSLGGDSLAAMELAAAVDEQFGIELEMGALLEAPTPRLLAARMNGRRAGATSPVFTLRSADVGTPFVCIAGGGGHALALRALADALGERPVLALQQRGLEEPAVADYGVRAIARRNVRALGALAHEGPLVVGGYSFGGVVAFEMARQLEEAGARPALLVLLDTPAPVDGAPTSAFGAGLSVSLERAPASERSQWARARSRAVGAAAWVVGGTRRRTRRGFEFATTGWIPRPAVEQDELFYQLGKYATRRYRPAPGFTGRTLVVRATGVKSRRDQRRGYDDLGWGQVAAGPVEVVGVATDHYGIIHPPAVAETGRVVEAAIRRAT